MGREVMVFATKLLVRELYCMDDIGAGLLRKEAMAARQWCSGS